MKTHYRLATILTILLSISPILTASAPSLYGPTGLITMPTGESLKYKEVSIAYDYVYAKNADDDVWYYKANLGTFQNWELGVVGGSSPEEGMYLNTKYYLRSSESRYAVSTAIGIQNIASKEDTDLYMVASKRFEVGLGAHLGFKANFNKKIDPSFMFGMDFFITDDLHILGDVTGKDEEYIGNIGVSFYPIPEMYIRVGIIDITENLYEKRRFSVGLGFSKYL